MWGKLLYVYNEQYIKYFLVKPLLRQKRGKNDYSNQKIEKRSKLKIY